MRARSRSPTKALSLSLDLITILLVLVTGITRLVYGGVLWGKYHDIWNHIPNYNHMHELWSVSLATWILCLVLPGLGPFICTCIFVSWTGQSKCAAMKAKFLEQTQAQGLFAEKWQKYVDAHRAQIEKVGADAWFDGYFRARCNTPNAVFWVMNMFDILVFLLLIASPQIKKWCGVSDVPYDRL